jgi:hypothetical protein
MASGPGDHWPGGHDPAGMGSGACGVLHQNPIAYVAPAVGSLSYWINLASFSVNNRDAITGAVRRTAYASAKQTIQECSA